jgi:hypothetical protein
MFIVLRISPMFQPVRGEGGLVGPLCSRNAHDKAVVVRRAQWETTEPALKGDGKWRRNACIQGPTRPPNRRAKGWVVDIVLARS